MFLRRYNEDSCCPPETRPKVRRFFRNAKIRWKEYWLHEKIALHHGQIVFALRQAESGTPVAEICQKMGIVEQTFYRWKKYIGMGVAEVRMLKILEE